MDAGQVQPITVRTGDVLTPGPTRSPASNTKSLAAMNPWSFFSHQLGFGTPRSRQARPASTRPQVTATAADSESPELPMTVRACGGPPHLLAGVVGSGT
jgi:hypothetical protein